MDIEFVEDPDLTRIGTSARGSFSYPSKSTYTGEYMVVPIPSFNRMGVIASSVVLPKPKSKLKAQTEEEIVIEPLKGCADVKHGTGVYYDVESNSTYDGEWAFDCADGKGTLIYHEEKTSYTVLIPHFPSHSKGIWSEGEICGPGRYTWADGSSYFGEWQDGVPSGVGVWSRNPKDIVKWNGVFDKGIALNLQYEVL